MVSQKTAATQKLAISHFAPQATKATIDGGDACTPGPKPHVPFSECASEPRGIGLVTPQLRTVRGLSITSRSDVVVATEPIRNNEKSSAVANWLESTPTNNIQALSLEEAAATIKRYDQRSPPKMPSLFGGSSASGATLSLKVRLAYLDLECSILTPRGILTSTPSCHTPLILETSPLNLY